MDLTTNYMGLTLRNPLVASAGPLSQTVAGVRELSDAGVGAVVMYSLFEEQMRREAERMAELEVAHEDSFPEALSYFPNVPYSTDDTAVTSYLRLVESAADAIEVPLFVPHPLLVTMVERIPEPGAATSTSSRPRLEKYDSWPVLVTDETPTTSGNDAGSFVQDSSS